MGAAGARVRPGRPLPLGAHWDGAGVNFAIWSEHGTAVDLCLFGGADPAREVDRIALRERTDHVWHAFVPSAGPGLRYGYRVHGPWNPAAGHRFNPAKLLLDPYARAFSGAAAPSNTVFAHRAGDFTGEFTPDDRDDAVDVPKSVVVDPAFDWADDRHLRTPWRDTILYEVHVKGFTARHPDVPADQRGTYAGLASPAALAHLTRLGITAVELLPVHQGATEPAIAARGLTNYWGYNSIGFSRPTRAMRRRATPGNRSSSSRPW